MENKLQKNVFAPHTKKFLTTNLIILNALVALLPAGLVKILVFGNSGANSIIVCTFTFIILEIILTIFLKNEGRVFSFSAPLLGFIMGLCLPASLPNWLLFFASFLCFFFKNIFEKSQIKINEVALALVAVFLVFSKSFVSAPLSSTNVKLEELFLGVSTNVLPSICQFALILGAGYLMILKVVDWKTPVFCTLFSFMFFLIFSGFSVRGAMLNLFYGLNLFACLFLAGFFASSPQTLFGKIVYSFIFGFLLCVLNVFGSGIICAPLAVVLCNLLVKSLDDFAFYVLPKIKKK